VSWENVAPLVHPSSMEQMAANIQQNADNSQQTEKIALLSSESVKNGAESSSVAVKSMNEIADKIQIRPSLIPFSFATLFAISSLDVFGLFKYWL